jgi:formyltetrahydrofolate-dependent phosphoribosylglycinamide formyltransferase
MAQKRIAILISGRGSNMAALIEAAREPSYPGAIVRVIANDPTAPGLAVAANQGIATAIRDHRAFGRDRAAHELAVDALLHEAGADIVCLAGYMRLLTPWFVTRWEGRLLNVHPSLLPAFPGLHTHRRALEAGVKLHGCTVHLVTETMDEGPILAQAAVPVLDGDTEATLAARVLAQEHIIYPQAVAAYLGATAMPPTADAALRNPLPAPPAIP